ncbi:MAG: hypothetical protein RJA44_608 [Pseudomonadota bacterium]
MESNIHAEMKRPMTRLLLPIRLRRLLPAALLCLGLLAAGAAQAERADREQPLEIDAGQVRIDGKRKLRVLSGGVEIRRGSLLIRAAQIELRETPQGDIAVAIGSEAEPALFRQKREGLDEQVEGRAQRVEYDTAGETVRLTQQAVLRRWNGGTLAEELSGQSILYDHVRESFEVQGGSAAGGRVRAVVAPRPPKAPAAPASGAAP